MGLAWVSLFVFIDNFERRSAPFIGFVFALLVGPIVGSFICFRFVSWLLVALRTFSGGRVLGAFGLLLTGVGVLGEVYQAAVLFAGP